MTVGGRERSRIRRRRFGAPLVRRLRSEPGAPARTGKYLQRCVDLFTLEFAAGTTRIYVRSTVEPSVTPPPADKAL